MEGYGETSDTDSGIILHSGSDSPTVTTKDVTTHTRAMKLKHQSLQDSLQLCVLELKKLCIREAELTGKLSADYPLAPGEAPPKVRRRIGASFQLDEQSIPRGPKGSPLTLVDAELALQLKIYEAARRLCREEHQNKAVRRSRLQQCKREEKRVKELQESAFQLRLQHGRSSPLPAFSIPFREHGHSDDSSLSDSPVVDEDVHPPPPSSGPACRDQNQLPQTFPVSSPSTADSAILSSPFTPRRAGSPGLDSMLSFCSNPESEAPPIQPSPWTESSLDQPFQKTKKSRSSTKSTASSPASSQVLPPLEACLGNPSLPQQLSQLQLSDRLANGTPPTPELRLHRNLSLRISNPETPPEERSRGHYGPPETMRGYPPYHYGPQENSEDSHSEHSFSTRSGSVCQEQQGEFPRARHLQHPGPTGGPGPHAFQGPALYQSPRYQSGPSFNPGHYPGDVAYALDLVRGYHGPRAPSNRRDCMYVEVPGPAMMAPRRAPQEVRLSRSPSLWEPQRYRSNGPPRQLVDDHLKSWHHRNQFREPRPRSLDRQGAVRVKTVPDWMSPLTHNQRYQEQVLKSRVQQQRLVDDGPGRWFGEDSKAVSLV
ncbi:unnamed protein product [Lota lota]